MAQEIVDLFKKITGHAKEYGFIYPSSEIYDGLSAVYDYGPNGVKIILNNIGGQQWFKCRKIL
jgi:glycyl-tRNA synthetase